MSVKSSVCEGVFCCIYSARQFHFIMMQSVFFSLFQFSKNTTLTGVSLTDILLFWSHSLLKTACSSGYTERQYIKSDSRVQIKGTDGTSMFLLYIYIHTHSHCMVKNMHTHTHQQTFSEIWFCKVSIWILRLPLKHKRAILSMCLNALEAYLHWGHH